MTEKMSAVEITAVLILNFAVCVSILFATYAFKQIIDRYNKRRKK